MNLSVAPAIHLLHEAGHATLATHSTQLAGYPYATALPCVVDEAHRPLFCISLLAEHTKNLLADPRASLSVVGAENGNIQAGARMTLIGDVERFEPSPELVARYLRYQPDAKQYLELDFAFFRLHPKRIRFIGGVGRMGWIEEERWTTLPVLAVEEEAGLLQQIAGNVPARTHLLGLDCFGIDYLANGQRARQRFTEVRSAGNLAAAAPRIASGLR
ncbi:pyridoxamine 5'-phosphate oxidase [Aromatoleum toluvorans]|uniref:Pyridoxamine 5'-phosphate oxidase n=1 Tax=Aromatoleum toluvorans TaxID=92002 RepID=A0ABX1PUH8_9RHOO|nr:pyridoxamine 5'-phosphate oxidase family protein [Aromatoleum toluvorans]NMG43109.1 pyridoxamine 5'-phosphate oxidase [Aromatoleum toluvorans]